MKKKKKTKELEILKSRFLFCFYFGEGAFPYLDLVKNDLGKGFSHDRVVEGLFSIEKFQYVIEGFWCHFHFSPPLIPVFFFPSSLFPLFSNCLLIY